MVRIAAVALAAALFLPTLAPAQTQDVATAVRSLAPQLVAFAGSTANFQNLVNGLAQGTPVSLVAFTADGFQQTATFTPAGTLNAVQIAQTLEQARQSLITHGIAAPTPEQIGVALLGGRLATPAGTTTVGAILPNAQSASAGASASTAAPATNLQVEIRPANTAATTTLPGVVTGATEAAQAPTQTSDTPRVRNTSDTPFTANTSDTPLPPTAVPSAAGTVPPGGTVSNGGVTNTSPAAQMQGRR